MSHESREPSANRSDARSRLNSLRAACDGALEETTVLAAGEEREVPSLERLLEISRAMNRIHDRERLLAGLSAWLRELFDAENGFVVLFGDGGKPEVLSCHTREPVAGDPSISETILERVRRGREPVLIDDTSDQPDLRDQSSVEKYRIASVLCAPLIVGDEVIGALQFDHRGKPHPFPTSDLRLLALFAGQAATAFHNLQLIEELDRARHEMQETQAKLVQAERLSAVGEMATGIAHNFNNTLFVALGFCDVMLARQDLDVEMRTSIERIRTCSRDAANTVRRLQTMSHGRASKEQMGPTDPRRVIRELVEMTEPRCRQLAEQRDIEVEICMELEPTPPVHATDSDLREILTNMIFNSIDAMREDGAITIWTSTRGDQVFIAVSDDGIGMDEATQKRVFEPFFTTKDSIGSGFGLSMCWSIAHYLGGEIRVESEPGEGSTFTLRLPIAREPVPAPEPDPRPSTQRARILVIDDDPQVLETIRVLVEVMGHEVSDYNVPEEAIEKIGQDSFDLVITDLSMPGLGGEEVILELRRRRPDMPVVVLTGLGKGVQLDERVAETISAVLSKPISLDRLRSSIAQALDLN